MRRRSGGAASSRRGALLRRARGINRELRSQIAELGEENARLGALNRLAASLAGNSDLPRVLEIILDQALTVLQADAAALLLPDEARELYTSRAQRGLEAPALARVRVAAGGPAQGPALFRATEEALPDYAATLLAAGQADELALVPLHHEGRLAGLLALLGRSGAGRWQLAPAFAEQVAGPLASAQHHHETELGAAESTFLLQISQLLSSTSDVDAIVDMLAAEASDLTESDVCALYLYDPLSDGIELGAVQGVARQAVVAAGRQWLPICSLPAARRAASEARPVASEWSGEADLHTLFGPTCPLQTALTVPLRAHDSLLGFLFLARRAPRRFSQLETQLGLKLGTLAALALDSARLYADLREQMRQVRTAQTQLVEVEKMASLGRIVAGVAHELNNPLAIASGYAQILLDSEPSPAIRTDLERIDHAVRRTARVVRDLLAFARQQPIAATAIPLGDLVQTVLERQRAALRESSIEPLVEIEEGLPPARGDWLQLEDVLSQLIDNARRAILSRPGAGKLTIRVTCNERVQLSIGDDGPGIPPELLDKLFEPFLTTQEAGQGPGLGLAICYGIVRAHGGRIWAANNPSGGATIYVELPTATGAEPEPGKLALLRE